MHNKYLKIIFESTLYWIEVDDDSYAIRQIIEANGEIHISCREDCLAEGALRENDIGGEKIHITKDDFEDKWGKITMSFQNQWFQTKAKYKIGNVVYAQVLWNYPQGEIVDIDGVLGLCKKASIFKISHRFEAKIIGYDDVNFWLLIDY